MSLTAGKCQMCHSSTALWSAYEDYYLRYHRDVQSSHFKRHLFLIAWLSISPDWIKGLSSVSPPCFRSALSVSPPSPPSLHHSNHTRIRTPKPGKFKENLLPSIIDADEKSKLSGTSLACWTSQSTIKNLRMQILFSRPLNKELAFQEGSIDAGVSKALAHVCSLMMKVRKEPVTEGAFALLSKVVTMTFSTSFRPARILQHSGSMLKEV